MNKLNLKSHRKPTIPTGFSEHWGVSLMCMLLITIAQIVMNPDLNEFPFIFMVAMMLGAIYPDTDIHYSKSLRVFYMNSTSIAVGMGMGLLTVQDFIAGKLVLSIWGLSLIYYLMGMFASRRLVHRGLTHGVFGLILGSLMIGNLLNIGRGFDSLSLQPYWGALSGIAIHIVADFSGSGSLRGLMTFKAKGWLSVVTMILITAGMVEVEQIFLYQNNIGFYFGHLLGLLFSII